METQFDNTAQANRTVTQQPHNAEQGNSLQQAITLNPGGFGFIKNGGLSVFVPPPLVSRTALKDGMRTGGMAIQDRKRDGVPGWRAVTINNLEGALSRGS